MSWAIFRTAKKLKRIRERLKLRGSGSAKKRSATQDNAHKDTNIANPSSSSPTSTHKHQQFPAPARTYSNLPAFPGSSHPRSSEDDRLLMAEETLVQKLRSMPDANALLPPDLDVNRDYGATWDVLCRCMNRFVGISVYLVFV